MLAKARLMITKALTAVLGPADRGEDTRTPLERRLEEEADARPAEKAMAGR